MKKNLSKLKLTLPDILLGIAIFITILLIGINIKPKIEGVPSMGKPRNVNMELLQKRILEKTLSDEKAKFFKVIQ